MKLGRRVTLALLGTIILFNVLLRYPRTEHEIGVDSFFIHVLSGAIAADGYAEWILNPLSYFGWYPLSYPSAGPFFIASLSSITNLNLEATILLSSLLFGPIGILGAFIMAREFRDDTIFALTVAFTYGLAPRFLMFTLWTGSTRNLFMALVPIFVWSLLRDHRRGFAKHYPIIALSLTVLAATHRLVALLFVMTLAFVVSLIIFVALQVLRVRFPRIFLRNSFRMAAPHLALAATVVAAGLTMISTNVLEEYSQGELLEGSELHIELLNLSISIARIGGLALPLSLIGLVALTRQRNKTIRDIFLAVALVSLVPTFFLREYTGFYILPFLATFGGLGFVAIIRSLRTRPRAVGVVAVGLLLGVAGFSSYVLDMEINRSSAISYETYGTGLYVRYMDFPGTLVANDGLTGIRVASIAGVKVLPVGGAGTSFQGPELLAYGFYAPEEVFDRVVRISLLELTIESDSLWVAMDIQAELDWVRILQSPYGQVPTGLADRYGPSYFLELNSAAGRFLAYDNVYCSNLGLTVNDSAYRVYVNEHESLWWLHAPEPIRRSSDPVARCQ